MPGKPENKWSEKGEAKGHGKHPAEKVSKIESEHVGSSDGNGIRFPLHNHPDKSVVTPGGA
jgi:hypothetical protein